MDWISHESFLVFCIINYKLMFLQISHSFSQISIFNSYTLFQRVKNVWGERYVKGIYINSKCWANCSTTYYDNLQHTMTIFQKLIWKGFLANTKHTGLCSFLDPLWGYNVLVRSPWYLNEHYFRFTLKMQYQSIHLQNELPTAC